MSATEYFANQYPLTFRPYFYPEDYPCPFASNGVEVGPGWTLLVNDIGHMVELEVRALVNAVSLVELIHRMEHPLGFRKPLDVQPPVGKVGWYHPYRPYLPYCLQVKEIPGAKGMSFALSTSELLDEHPAAKSRIQWVLRDISRRARRTCAACGEPASKAHSIWRSLCAVCSESQLGIRHQGIRTDRN